MKKLLIMTALVGAMGFSHGAQAQDAGYSYYGAQVPRGMAVDRVDGYQMRQSRLQYQYQNMEPRGGRDPRGGFYGRQTVWPGDYKDALDRGSWPAGDRAISIAPQRQWPD